jgi:hypothetical protein
MSGTGCGDVPDAGRGARRDHELVRTPNVSSISTLPTAHESGPRKTCGHEVHTGSCPQCQRAQLARWAQQLAEVAGKEA